MAIYPVVNKETGEKQIIEMSVHDIMKWYEENPEWQRDWSEGSASPGEVGEWRDKLYNKHPGWTEVLKSSAKSAASKNQIKF